MGFSHTPAHLPHFFLFPYFLSVDLTPQIPLLLFFFFFSSYLLSPSLDFSPPHHTNWLGFLTFKPSQTWKPHLFQPLISCLTLKTNVRFWFGQTTVILTLFLRRFQIRWTHSVLHIYLIHSMRWGSIQLSISLWVSNFNSFFFPPILIWRFDDWMLFWELGFLSKGWE